MDALNSLTRLVPTVMQVIGTVLYTSTTPSLSQLGGFAESDQAQVTVAISSTGVCIISVTNFRGLNGYLAGIATGTTISNMVSCTTQSYTANTDTANFTFKVEDDASTAVDQGFNFILSAF